MPKHIFRNARGVSLARNLASLGIFRVLALQADPRVRAGYEGNDLIIDTFIEDIATWVVDNYAPTPILSPWNEGSGFGVKDKTPKDAIAKLLALDDTRLRAFQHSYKAVKPYADQARAEGWDKAETVRQIRNRCPDEMLPWLDSAVVALDANDLAFPPILGTGGNDGRLDFSTNFHQRLLEVLVDPKDKRRPGSLALLRDLLDATSHAKLHLAPIGQFDPGGAGAPNTSPLGSASSLVNPWEYVFVFEGALLYRSSAARKFSTDVRNRSRAAMTYMSFSEPGTTIAGADDEENRGELWVPIWSRSLSFADVSALFGEGRAVWRGKSANRSSEMFLAAASNGVASNVDRFDRYLFAQRNGLAYAALFTESIERKSASATELVALVEDWADRAGRLGSKSGSASVIYRRFTRARVDLARATGARQEIVAAREMLASVTELELAIARSRSAREQLAPQRRRFGNASTLLRLIDNPADDSAWRGLAENREFQVAVGLAAVRVSDGGVTRTLRDFVVPLNVDDKRIRTWRDSPIVPGFDTRPLADVLTEVLMRAAITSTAPNSNLTGSKKNPLGVRGLVLPRARVKVPPDTAHAWVAGELDESEIHRWLLALLALDWSPGGSFEFGSEKRSPAEPITSLYALLAPFRYGFPPSNDERRKGTPSAGQRDEADDGSNRSLATGPGTLGPLFGLQADWISQLIAGHDDRVADSVTRRLRQFGLSPGTRSSRSARSIGKRVASALLLDIGKKAAQERLILAAPRDPKLIEHAR